MFQVWHKEGDAYRKVAEVDMGNPQAAAMFTTDGFGGVERWRDQPSVTAMPGDHRSTTFGDIIIAPDGVEYRFGVKEGGYPGFTEVTIIHDQEYGKYLAEQELTYDYDKMFQDMERDIADVEMIRGYEEIIEDKALERAVAEVEKQWADPLEMILDDLRFLQDQERER